MTMFFDLLPAALGGAAAANAATIPVGTVLGGTVAAGAQAATTGLTLSQILSGTATILSVATGMAGANADAAALEEQATETDMKQNDEIVQGRARQLQIKRDMMDAIGQRDVAAAASGVDLSFGTAAQVRKDAFREADYALNTNTMTTMSNMSQLKQRAATLRKRAGQVRSSGILNALTNGISGFADINK